MSEPFDVELAFAGEPFDAAAVRHAARHLALRAGFRLVPRAARRLVYASLPDARGAGVGAAHAGADAARRSSSDLVVLTSADVARTLAAEAPDRPFPLRTDGDGRVWPFPHPDQLQARTGVIADDLLAGFHAVTNLWWERRTRPSDEPGGICAREDWWAKAGLPEPLAFADAWLGRLVAEMRRLGWPVPTGAAKAPAIVLTHDVDYLPGPRDRGLPRALRAVARHTLARKRPLDAARVLGRYARALPRGPYAEAVPAARAEARADARSAFLFVVANGHRNDPTYARDPRALAPLLRALRECGSEIGLHGSHEAARTPGALSTEKALLEEIAGAPVTGYRQHYLNFHPVTFFRELDGAGFRYDLSVGYNDRSGPRAGTMYPYRPYDLERRRPHDLWEIPFVLMDTTLATTYRLGEAEARAHAVDRLASWAGAPSIIWHAEQMGGLLDPGYDQVYFDLLGEARARGIRRVAPEDLLPELDRAWSQTVAGDGDAGAAFTPASSPVSARATEADRGGPR